MIDRESLGSIAFEAFGGISSEELLNNDAPSWHDLSEGEREAFRRVGEACLEHLRLQVTILEGDILKWKTKCLELALKEEDLKKIIGSVRSDIYQLALAMGVTDGMRVRMLETLERVRL